MASPNIKTFFLLSLVTLMMSCLVQTRANPLPPSTAGLTVMSWDMELYQGSYGIFLDRFVDANRVDAMPWKTSIPEDVRLPIAENYLNHPRAFENLSPALRAKLSEGLIPPPRAQVILHQNEIVSNSRLVDRSGQTLKDNSHQLLQTERALPAQGPRSIIAHSAPLPATYTTGRSGILLQTESIPHLEVQAKNDLTVEYRSKLIKRWKTWATHEPDAAMKEVKFKFLPPALKEKVFRTSSTPKELLALKHDDPFFHRIEAEWDRNTLELKLKKDQLFTDRKEFVKFTKMTCESLQCSKMVMNPRESARAGIHYHVTINPIHPSHEVYEVMKLYKLKNALELVANEEYSVLGNNSNSYAVDLKLKGNVRHIDLHHYEVREPLTDPETLTAELDALFKIADSSPHTGLGDSKKRIKAQITDLIRSRWNDLEKLGLSSKETVDFNHILTGHELSVLPSPANWQKIQNDMKEALGAKSEWVQKINALEPRSISWNEKAWDEAFHLLSLPKYDKRSLLSQAIAYQFPYSQTEWKKLAEFIGKNPEHASTSNLLGALSGIQWSDEFWNGCANMLSHPHLSTVRSHSLLTSMRQQREWPELIWKALADKASNSADLRTSIEMVMIDHLDRVTRGGTSMNASAEYLRSLRSIHKKVEFSTEVEKAFTTLIPSEEKCLSPHNVLRELFGKSSAGEGAIRHYRADAT